ncbi:hypothetical protein Dsin_003459 [Dipteronia sinensis]|uniref:Exo_endo_phos domain-containing protein n=1 Tax=Dipteronia sinensis TaxID=43782 RepID=A0AAE0EK92_9ROSI|nr:hypothetical protein Dsin_003459 [Dipteronia sinensis]
MTGFYRHSDSSQRHHGWTLFRRLSRLSELPWVFTDDFNDILDDSEKLGGSQRPRHLMENFRAALDDCDLQDIGWTLFRRLSRLSALPWVFASDFNDILDDSEKLGGSQRPRHLMENFRAALDDCDL